MTAWTLAERYERQRAMKHHPSGRPTREFVHGGKR